MNSEGAEERRSGRAKASTARICWLMALVPAVAWAAVNLVLGLVVARLAFILAKQDHLTRDQAGLLFGEVLGQWSTIATVLAAISGLGLIALAIQWLRHRRWISGSALMVLIAITAGTHLGSHQAAQEGNALNGQRMAAKQGGAVDVELEQRFAAVHRRSYAWFLGETGAALAISAVAAVALGRRLPGTSTPSA